MHMLNQTFYRKNSLCHVSHDIEVYNISAWRCVCLALPLVQEMNHDEKRVEHLTDYKLINKLIQGCQWIYYEITQKVQKNGLNATHNLSFTWFMAVVYQEYSSHLSGYTILDGVPFGMDSLLCKSSPVFIIFNSIAW